ncbi:hypothetical protein CQA18_25285, partial [Enterobacter hormaechei]|uniref:IclR family transcriptional regulator domain-containing protein n=1 Tax=Enterobacter hormaechei TaxID=158836 RepID=UPI000BCE496A
THATLVSPVHLKEDLAQTRKRGYSFDDEEHALGLRCLAACIFDEHREPFAAISISGPISRITHATLVSPVHLKEDLAQTRKRGYSFDDEEHALG